MLYFKTLDYYCDKMNEARLMTQITEYMSDCFSCDPVSDRPASVLLRLPGQTMSGAVERSGNVSEG